MTINQRGRFISSLAQISRMAGAQPLSLYYNEKLDSIFSGISPPFRKNSLHCCKFVKTDKLLPRLFVRSSLKIY